MKMSLFKLFVCAIFSIFYVCASAQTPTITSFSPSSGAVGSLITIIGTKQDQTVDISAFPVGVLFYRVTSYLAQEK
jgi:hypothetical protein